MAVRRPVVAGQFYPGTRAQCLKEIEQCLAAQHIEAELPARIVAGIVPHAGWGYSGNLAAMVFAAVRQTQPEVDTFVLFGAAHRYYGMVPAVYPQGAWQTPLGEVGVDEDLAGAIADKTIAEGDEAAHRGEHSIEVQLPFIQHLFPKAMIVPIAVPAESDAPRLGEEVAAVVADAGGKRVVAVASTDLTHYGPGYGFAPAGAGDKGIRWAKEVNDKGLFDAALALDAGLLQQTAIENGSACGPGAAAAAVALARKLGSQRGVLLAHTTSSEIVEARFHEGSSESVGYAAIVF